MGAMYPYYLTGAPFSYGYPSKPVQAGVPGAAPQAVPASGVAVAADGGMPTAGAPMTMEESYIENILRLNLGKMATIYMTFARNPDWPSKIFRGRLEAAGRDHIIVSDPETGKRYLLLMVNLDYITFDEPLQYFYPPAATPRHRFR